MRILIIPIIIILTISGYSQPPSSTTKKNQSIKVSQYVIGIGNYESVFYNKVLQYLKTDTKIEVYAICESHRIIGFKTTNNTYKSYDVVRDLLLTEFYGIKLSRKDDSILINECKDEILKQK